MLQRKLLLLAVCGVNVLSMSVYSLYFDSGSWSYSILEYSSVVFVQLNSYKTRVHLNVDQY